jgi:hypothetical protein
MSRVVGTRRAPSDHFEPDEDSDPKAQRLLRGALEQIDVTAYAANKKLLGSALAGVDIEAFQRMAQATAMARARWIVGALATTENGQPPSGHQIEAVAQLRAAFEELTAAYEGMRRMVERGYLVAPAPPAPPADPVG